VFPSVFCSLSPPSYLPWLHGHYPASSLLRRLCHLPGAVLRPLRAAMNAAPSRLVIPDSCRSNFLPFYHHPPHAFRFPRSLSRRGSVSLCCRSPFPGSFPFRASPFPPQARQCIRPYRVHHFLNYGLAIRFRLLSTPSLDDAVTFNYGQPVPLSDRDFHPAVGAHSQAHGGRLLGGSVARKFHPVDRRMRFSR
jgi:hypothetical protein